jgi:hypothetical protein
MSTNGNRRGGNAAGDSVGNITATEDNPPESTQAQNERVRNPAEKLNAAVRS